jgi:uncharacterized protein
MPHCPVCGVSIELEKTPTAPFCTERCQTIDLGRWLNEAYHLPEPVRGDDDEGDRPSDSPD